MTTQINTETSPAIDEILQRLTSGETFTIKEKRPSDPMVPTRLRRLPRGSRCNTDVWSEQTPYTIDKERNVLDRFLMFKTEHYKTNWWIDSITYEICYDASSSIKTNIERDPLSNFNFIFSQ